jgi:hypothetical protein
LRVCESEWIADFDELALVLCFNTDVYELVQRNAFIFEL